MSVAETAALLARLAQTTRYIVDGYQVFNLAMFEYSFGPFTPRTATINLSSDTVITGAPSGKQALVSFAARDGDDAYTVNI